jgi:hypothetical protein
MTMTPFKQMWRSVATLAFIVLLLAGCGHAQDRPTHKDALDQISKLISEDGSTITKPVYVNGFRKDSNDYIVLMTFTRNFMVSSSTYEKSTADNPIIAFAESVALSSLYGHFEPGDSFDEACKFRFPRTENGWILQGYEGDAEVVNRHTPHADALDEQKKRLDEQRAQEEKVQRQKEIDAAMAQATAAANERDRHLVEVKNACASGQQMKVIGYGNIPVQGLQGARAGALDRYLGSGQVVVGVPDDAQSLATMEAILNPGPNFIGGVPPKIDLLGWLRGMCRVQYSVRHFDGNRMFSGYVPVESLGLLKQGDGQPQPQSNPGAMSGNGASESGTALLARPTAVITQAGLPYFASPQAVHSKPLGQFALNTHVCVTGRTYNWNGLHFFQYVLPSGELVYTLEGKGIFALDAAGEKSCMSQVTSTTLPASIPN